MGNVRRVLFRSPLAGPLPPGFSSEAGSPQLPPVSGVMLISEYERDMATLAALEERLERYAQPCVGPAFDAAFELLGVARDLAHKAQSWRAAYEGHSCWVRPSGLGGAPR